ncbi:MAG: hypothetical protein D3905_15575 [Candidatus Electrothrix sp. AS4_5]|nr:hypothetical protein [Candidatus Electrothrix gigas]
MAERELCEYMQFHKTTESLWQETDKQLQSNLIDILKKIPEEHHQDTIDAYSWELHQNQYKFPDIHRESLVIAIYNFVEAELNRLCSIISESIESKIKLKNLHGQGVNRALLYLSKVAELDMSKMGGERSYIKEVNRLRNAIVHRGGFLLEDKNDELNRFVSENPNLSGQPGNKVSLAPALIEELINNLIEFFKKLGSEVHKFINS